jgi:hypothetical protein
MGHLYQWRVPGRLIDIVRVTATLLRRERGAQD